MTLFGQLAILLTMLVVSLLFASASASDDEVLATTATAAGTDRSIEEVKVALGPARKLLTDYYTALQGEEGAFDKLIRIFGNSSLSAGQREEQLVGFLSQLPDAVKLRLPVPPTFAKYEDEVKSRLCEIYYRRDTPMAEKWLELGRLLQAVPDPEYHFLVDATFKGFDGVYSRKQLQQVLTKEELASLDAIRSDTSLSERERRYAVGHALQRAYTSADHPQRRANWPALEGTEGLPAVVDVAVKELLLASGPKNISMFVRAYREGVVPYLAGGSVAEYWRLSCPCQAADEKFWAGYRAAEAAKEKKEKGLKEKMGQLIHNALTGASTGRETPSDGIGAVVGVDGDDAPVVEKAKNNDNIGAGIGNEMGNFVTLEPRENNDHPSSNEMQLADEEHSAHVSYPYTHYPNNDEPAIAKPTTFQQEEEEGMSGPQAEIGDDSTYGHGLVQHQRFLPSGSGGHDHIGHHNGGGEEK